MAKIKNILKNKFLLLILGIIILIIIILVIFLKETPNELQNDSNDESIKEEINYYTVTFDSNGGTNIDSVVVKENDVIIEPSSPEKEGYTFEYWELDGKQYDFNTKVTSEITLIAKWQEIDKEQDDNQTDNQNNNQSTNNQTTNNQSSSNTNSNKTDVINLNDDISVTLYHIDTGDPSCFFYMHATNLESVFPNAEITKNNNGISYVYYSPFEDAYALETEISNEDITNNLDTIKFNATKENKLKSTFEKYKNSKYSGISNITYSIDNHRISFSYDYIFFNGLDVESDGMKANEEIQEILTGSTLFRGPCGSYDTYSNDVLTEELCDEYNLKCDRW